MNIVVTGGGTGGHIYPALAVAEVLRDDPQVETLLYIGKKDSLEQDIIPRNGIPFEGIVFSGMPRKLSPAWFSWVMALKRSTEEARHLLQTARPDVVFGTGGYVSAPVLMAALQLRIPYVIHEPDAHPGLVNRLMGRWAGRVTGAFAEAQKMIRNRHFTVTGNPIRGEVGKLSRTEGFESLELPWSLDDKVLVVTGGSQGSRTLNQAVVGALNFLVDEAGFKVIHQSGAKLYDETVAEARLHGYENHPAYLLRPFYDRMAAVLACADLAICRAGSMTLSELYLCGIPSILVPYPFAAADHQKKNALASQKAGASMVLLDEDCHDVELSELVDGLLHDPGKLPAMKEASRRLAHPEATRTIAEILKSYAPQ